MKDPDYEKWKKDCEEIRIGNKVLFGLFEQWLKDKGLSTSTIRTHLDYVFLYADNYLLYYDAQKSTDTASFWGFCNWFERKVGYGNLKSAIASCKKFYKFLHESKLISDEIYEDSKSFSIALWEE